MLSNFTYLTSANRAEESGLNLTIREKPIQEDESEANLAMHEMANTLRMVSQPRTPLMI